MDNRQAGVIQPPTFSLSLLPKLNQPLLSIQFVIERRFQREGLGRKSVGIQTMNTGMANYYADFQSSLAVGKPAYRDHGRTAPGQLKAELNIRPSCW
ncbi:hypothetical protein [Pseudomonas veronii]|uniref:hypothetical protein n=1 Tax=Pseudomonas TaxID=286 RepID=UPI001474307F|nr:hypothetical protein [Pseudomonas veronii]NMX53245.1 hypothetical protein [Pseudomonas veronii]